MKIIPCPSTQCAGRPALATRDGLYQTAGRLSARVVTFKCRRCGRPFSITSQQFARLPEMSVGEIAAKTCDLPLSALNVPPPAPPAPPAPPDRTPSEPES